MLYEKETRGSVAEVTERVGDAASRNDLGVLGTHNLKEAMAAKGVVFEPEVRVIELCSPKQAKLMLESDMSVSSALPCRISVFEEGGKVKVSAIKPSLHLGQFDNPVVGPIAKELDEIVKRIIDAACK